MVDITNITNTSSYYPPAVTSNAAAVSSGAVSIPDNTPDASDAVAAQVPSGSDKSQPDENARLNAVKQAAAADPKYFYPLGDKSFTIYKQNGVYYTQYTSLINGTRTTVPEPETLAQYSQGSAGSLLDATA